MRFTGTNILTTPRVQNLNFLFEDITVDSTGVYQFSAHQFARYFTTGYNAPFFYLSGNKVLDSSGAFISTYNTGEAFSVSGWYDYPLGFKYITIGGIGVRTPEKTQGSGYVGSIEIRCPTNASLTCDMRIYSLPMSVDVTMSSYAVGGISTGTITSSTPMLVDNDRFQFYQSYEALLTGYRVVAYIDDWAGTVQRIRYKDNDTSQTNDTVNFDYKLRTTYGDILDNFTVSRTGLYNSGIFTILATSTGTGFSSLFDGNWSGSGFSFQDEGGTLNLEYYLSVSDVAGNFYPKTGYTTYYFPNINTWMPADYITGFMLTNTGEYMSPPVLATTGYYYCTGLQQALNSMLFSSGCTSNLLVTFSGQRGTGASGWLQLTPVTFSGVYGSGTQRYNLVTDYLTLSQGSGYTIAPRAYLTTGGACFDVPKASGYSYGWYKPFDTSGTMDLEAGYFTGVALCQTGLVGPGGIYTGYIVTGIDVYNIGSGYSSGLRPPLLSFIRTGVDTLTNNASGVLLMKTGTYYTSNVWSVWMGLAGSTMKSGSLGGSGITMAAFDNQLAVMITVSGLDVTVPVTGQINVFLQGVSYPSILTQLFSYSKYYDPDPYALKKKRNVVETFNINEDLSFALTQTELDTLYSSAGYTDNTWPYSDGDFDF